MNSTAASLVYQNTSQKVSRDRPLPYADLVGWSFIYCLVAIPTIINNAFAIAVLTTRKILRKRANYFLLCLAIADLLVGAVSIPLYIAALVLWWQLGESANPIRKVYAAIDILTGYASIFTLTTISVERLCAIVFPIKHRVASTRTYHLLTTCIWLSAALHAGVYLMHVNVPAFPKLLFFYMTRVTAFLSFFVLCFAYAIIYVKVRARKRKPVNENQVDTAASQERILLHKSFILSVMLIATWLPFNILTFVGTFCVDCVDVTYQVIFVVKLFHFLNSFLNPFVYTFRDKEFRKILLKMVKKIRNPSGEQSVSDQNS